MWRDQAAFLRSPDGGAHAVFAPDLPGFGPEPTEPAPAPESASIEGFACHVHALIGAVGGRAIVAGLSMGGYILLALLRQFPADVAAAVLMDTRPDADSDDARANRMKSIEEVAKNGSAGFIESMLPRLLGPGAQALAKDRCRQIMQRQSPQAIIAAQTSMAARRDQTDLLPRLTIPVQIIVGAQDVITPPSVALAMQSRIPRAMLVQIAGSGHMSALEQPASVNSALHSFIAKVKVG